MIATKNKYKATGLKWISEIPEHWELKRLGGLFEERNETVSENDFMPLSVTMQGIVPQLESAAKTMHVDNRKKVCIGDFAINSRSDRRGSGGLSTLEGSVSIVNTVLKPSAYYLPEYTHFLLTNKLFQDEYYAKGKGIVADMWSTRFSEMKTIFLPVPPKHEQDEIVQYIKAQEEKINLFIQKKQRFIELLKEQKSSMVYKTITNGLSENVTFKLSDIPFAEKFPIHYKIEKFNKYVFLRHGFQFRDYDFTDEGVKIVKITQLNPNGYLDLTKANTIDESRIKEFSDIIINEGDILMALTGGTIGKIIRADIKDEVLLQNYRVGNFIPLSSEELDKDYLYLQLSSPFIQKQINYHVRETGQPNIGKGDFRKIFLVIPPIKEQKQIVSHIKTETATIDTAIAKAEREIELIREYKEAMIAEAVLGKRKKILK